MLKRNGFVVNAITDIGQKRQKNEDRYGLYAGDFGKLHIVSDGLGGHNGGEIASKIAVQAIYDYFNKLGNLFDPFEELNNSYVYANEKIELAANKNADIENMGCTLVTLLIYNDKIYIANLGDCRVYRISNSEIKQITTDHSLVQELLDEKLLTVEESLNHPNKNIITKCLGAGLFSKPDIYGPFEIVANENYMLCSDGLTTHVEDDEILTFAKMIKGKQLLYELVDLANMRGGKDNITIVLLNNGFVLNEQFKTFAKFSSAFVIILLFLAFILKIINLSFFV